jgi:acetylornithine deacetylase/succinyl-diaminopimelate desuccinylase-like protein
MYRFRDYLEETFPAPCIVPPLFDGPAAILGTRIDSQPAVRMAGSGIPTLPGILLMSHFDVVPIETKLSRRLKRAPNHKWTHERLSADTLTDTYLWGRGTLDCKHGVMAILEAINRCMQPMDSNRSVRSTLPWDMTKNSVDMMVTAKMAEWMRSEWS